MQGDQLAVKECYLAMDEQVQMINIEEKRMVAEPIEVLEYISLNKKNPERCTRVGVDLEEKIKKDLIRFLRKSIDICLES